MISYSLSAVDPLAKKSEETGADNAGRVREFDPQERTAVSAFCQVNTRQKIGGDFVVVDEECIKLSAFGV